MHLEFVASGRSTRLLNKTCIDLTACLLGLLVAAQALDSMDKGFAQLFSAQTGPARRQAPPGKHC